MRRKQMGNFIKPLLSLKTKKGYSILSVIMVALFSIWVISDALKAEVVVAADGETLVVKTYQNTVGDLLEEMGIDVDEHDHLSHSVKMQVEDGMEILFKTAQEVTITIDNEEHIYYTTAETVSQFLEENGFEFSNHDDISHSTAQRIEDGLHIVVNKAFQVELDNGGKESKVWTTGGTVADILADEEIEYGELDRITPALNKKITEEDTLITIVNINIETETVEEKVAFETEERKDSSLAKGKEKVLSEGREGLVEKTYEVVYENGKEAERKLIEEDVKKESKNRVLAVGTKEVQQAVATANSKQTKSSGSSTNKATESPSGGKEFTMQATAYTASCNGCSGYTATGINLNANRHAKVIAVDPNVIPLGSKVWVEGYGVAIAGDTGGSIKGNRIDAHVPSKDAAMKFGRRTVKVKVLD